MTKADLIVDRGADRLEQLSAKASASRGIASKLAEPLAEDARFLRKLKPSLIAARARGELPTDEPPGGGNSSAPPGPRLGERPKPKRTSKPKQNGGGPNPWLVLAAALTTGILLARWIDWRGHAHPRD
jgi:hypothetical protein